MTENDFVSSEDDAWEILEKDPRSAFATSTLEPLRARDTIRLKEFQDSVKEKIAFAFPLNSEFYSLFSYQIR